jgi:hypothetical protein
MIDFILLKAYKRNLDAVVEKQIVIPKEKSYMLI